MASGGRQRGGASGANGLGSGAIRIRVSDLRRRRAAVGPATGLYGAQGGPERGRILVRYGGRAGVRSGPPPRRSGVFQWPEREQNFGKVVRLLEYDVGSRWNIVWELSQLRIALSAGDLAKADECSKTILRRVAGQEKFDSPEAIAALPAEVLLVVDATWRWAGNGRLADRRWVRKPSRGKITTFINFTGMAQEERSVSLRFGPARCRCDRGPSYDTRARCRRPCRVGYTGSLGRAPRRCARCRFASTGV